MLKIGLTGGIGSGKTTVARIFESLGVPVYYADDRARRLQNEDPIRSQISKLFGEQVYSENKLQRQVLAQIVFNDASKLAALNAIVHPAVQLDFSRWLSEQTSRYILKEAAIIFEIGSHKQYDKVILVTAPEKTRIERVTQRDRVDTEAVLARMSKQMSDQEKIPLADYLIHNTSLEATKQRVLDLHKTLLSL